MAVDNSNLNLYSVLNISQHFTGKQIRKAYKKRALEIHPDKNPKPEAVQEFQHLRYAFEILTDPAKKDAYDEQLRAKEAAKERRKKMDAKRKKIIDDLEARENLAKKKKADEDEYKKLERMRREAQRELEEDQERTLQLHRQKQNPPNRIYDNATMKAFEERMSERLGRKYTANIINKFQPNDAAPTLGIERDFESVVMMRMRQAAERQRLIKQMQKEDEEETCQKFNKDITKTPIK